MQSELSPLVATLAEIIAKLRFVHRELQRIERQQRDKPRSLSTLCQWRSKTISLQA